MAADSGAGGRRSNKVARLIEEYDLEEGFGDRLERLWTADDGERESLRDLADRFNRRLLERAVSDAGTSLLGSGVETLYDRLTDDDVSQGVRTEAETRLERNGVDVEELRADFVSYQAIRSYLTEYRNAEYAGTDDADRIADGKETVQRLRSRLRAVTDTTLTQLRRSGRVTIGEFRLFVDVEVFCEDCETRYGVVDLLERGGCNCDEEEGG